MIQVKNSNFKVKNPLGKIPQNNWPIYLKMKETLLSFPYRVLQTEESDSSKSGKSK